VTENYQFDRSQVSEALVTERMNERACQQSHSPLKGGVTHSSQPPSSRRRGGPISKHIKVWKEQNIVIGPDGAGEGQQQYTVMDLKLVGCRSRQLVVLDCIVSS
jgi:hypothetical protein